MTSFIAASEALISAARRYAQRDQHSLTLRLSFEEGDLPIRFTRGTPSKHAELHLMGLAASFHDAMKALPFLGLLEPVFQLHIDGPDSSEFELVSPFQGWIVRLDEAVSAMRNFESRLLGIASTTCSDAALDHYSILIGNKTYEQEGHSPNQAALLYAALEHPKTLVGLTMSKITAVSRQISRADWYTEAIPGELSC